MWTWSLEWAEVSSKLLVGSCPMKPEDLKRIQRETGATALLSLQHDDCHSYWGIDYPAMYVAGRQSGLTMKRCPMRDFDIDDQRRRLPAAVSMLARLQLQGHRTYVHCTAGLGRSPLTILAYLSLVEGIEAEQAMESIRRVRAGVVPSWEAFYGYREALLTMHRDNITERAYTLYCQGVPGNAERHWFLAQRQILRDLFTLGNGP